MGDWSDYPWDKTTWVKIGPPKPPEIKMGKRDESSHMLDMLMSAVGEAKNGSSKQTSDFSNSDAEKQHEEWAKKIKESNSFDVGDKIVRNRFGQRKYNKPLEGQYAVIRHVFI